VACKTKSATSLSVWLLQPKTPKTKFNDGINKRKLSTAVDVGGNKISVFSQFLLWFS